MRRHWNCGGQSSDRITSTRCTSMNNLGVSYLAALRPQDALPLLEQTLELQKLKLGPDAQFTILTMHNVAQTYYQAGRLDEAMKLQEQTLTLMRARLGSDHLNTAEGMAKLAQTYLRLGRSAEAESLARESLELRRQKMPESAIMYESMCLLGRSLAGQGRHADAESLLVDGYHGLIARKINVTPLQKLRLNEVLDSLVKLYEDTGKPKEAEQWRKLREPSA